MTYLPIKEVLSVAIIFAVSEIARRNAGTRVTGRDGYSIARAGIEFCVN
jgi:hypothetical protein